MAEWERQGATDEWYTPACVFEALGCRFDLDVACPPAGPVHVPADAWLSESALQQRWRGFVWMNPPFGKRDALRPWLQKFFEHGRGIALTPDRTSAPWFQAYAPRADALLFTRKLRFLRPDGSEGKSPANGTALWAAGPAAVAALERAAQRGFGFLVR